MKAEPIDLRSDTVTRPTPAMRRAIAVAEVGDDLFGDDPTAQRLQSMVAERLGKEAALFVPTGTMANEIAIKLHTQPSDEVLCEADSHIFHYETGAAALLSGVTLSMIVGERGQITPEQVRAARRPDSFHSPRSRLLVIENTHNHAGGTVWSPRDLSAIAAAGRAEGLRLHLDGARLWNAAIATGRSVAELAAPFDSVSVCLSKGLGAPVGSLIAGSHSLMEEALRWRKLFGGAMRQVGILAAAGLHALEHHVERLIDDHRRAQRFADVAAALGFTIAGAPVESNIVIFDVAALGLEVSDVVADLAREGVRVNGFGGTRVRAVFHLDIDDAAAEAAGEALKRVAG